MCGICGEWFWQRMPEDSDRLAVQRMVALIRRRGPDDEGLWTDHSRCRLGFRRLSILDRSARGHQPMTTPDGRYALVFNGEVYNFRELRKELESQGVSFRSTGDSEVVFRALIRWGENALARFNGMFALAFYVAESGKLLLARDHAGIKPLFLGQTPQGVVFGSQFDQLMIHPWIRNLPVSQDALAVYLRLGHLPSPLAILENCESLAPGNWIEFSPDGVIRRGTYFDFSREAAADLHGQEAMEAVDAVVSEAVQRQMVSDVPVGCALSGGIDSPLVAAKIAAMHGRVPAFTIATEGLYDESRDASHFAGTFGHDHVLRRIQGENTHQLIEDVVSSLTEPLADFSIFPTLLLSSVAAERVRVLLSGDGGDELFWGYAPRFSSALRRLGEFDFRPSWLASCVSACKRVAKRLQGRRVDLIHNVGDWYKEKHCKLREPHLSYVLPDAPQWPAAVRSFECESVNDDHVAKWLRKNEFDVHLQMVLNKVDRASMFHSLEVRVPLLDLEVVRVAQRVCWRSCLDMTAGVGKQPLRASLKKHAMHQSAKKRGFTVPIGDWMRGPWRDRLESSLLSRTDLLGLPFNRTHMRRLYQEHCLGRQDHGKALFVLFMLSEWELHHYDRRLSDPSIPSRPISSVAS